MHIKEMVIAFSVKQPILHEMMMMMNVFTVLFAVAFVGVVVSR